MRSSQRLIASAVLISLCGVLAGCSSSLTNWDPSDMLDFLDTKKKLPGKREPVFPDGVPGIEQGVPKELYKSNVEQQQQQQQQAAAPAVVAPPAEEPKQPTRSRAKGKPAAGAAPAEDVAPTEEGSTAAAPPAPKPKRLVHRRSTSLPKDQPAPQDQAPPAQQQPVQQTQPAASPFPAPLPSGSFSR